MPALAGRWVRGLFDCFAEGWVVSTDDFVFGRDKELAAAWIRLTCASSDQLAIDTR